MDKECSRLSAGSQKRISKAMWNSMTARERESDPRLKDLNQGVLRSMWHGLTHGAQGLIIRRFYPERNL